MDDLEGRIGSQFDFRISTEPLRVPPLRERVNDVPALAEHLLGLSASEVGRHDVTLSPEALEAFLGDR